MSLRLLDRLLVKEVISYLTFGVALFTTILVAMQELQPLTSMVVEHGVPLGTAAEIFVLSLPYFIAFSFPMSMLLSTMLAFGRLSGDAETTALLAAGVSLYRMAAPVAIIGVLVSLLAISFNEIVAPVAMRTKNRIYDAAINAGVPTNRPFHFEKSSDGKTILLMRADNYDMETKKLVRPTLVYYNDGKPVAIEWAKEGRFRGGMMWTLQDGFIQQVNDNDGGSSVMIRFKEQPTKLGVSLQQLLTASQDPNALTFDELRARIDRKIRERRTAADIDTDKVILYSKVSIPFASLVFSLIGFPLGIRRQRSGSAIGFAVSIGIIFLYYLIYQYASILGNNGAIDPVVSAWIPDGLGLVVGGFLMKNASI